MNQSQRTHCRIWLEPLSSWSTAITTLICRAQALLDAYATATAERRRLIQAAVTYAVPEPEAESPPPLAARSQVLRTVAQHLGLADPLWEAVQLPRTPAPQASSGLRVLVVIGAVLVLIPLLFLLLSGRLF